MSGRILIVDDVAPNRRLLEARLEAEYFDVLTAEDGHEALRMAIAEAPDLILLDVMMPGIDGLETCRRLKSMPATRHIPVVLVTALDAAETRLAGLEAGADEFLTKPIDDVILLARVHSLLRLKHVLDDLRARRDSGAARGVVDDEDADRAFDAEVDADLDLLVIGDEGWAASRLIGTLEGMRRPRFCSDPRAAIEEARRTRDAVVIDLTAASFDGLRLAARLRADERARETPIIAVVDLEDRYAVARALELGVNDVVAAPVDPQEFQARLRAQVRRKRYADYLRDALAQGVELALTDQLTGLNNRRVLDTRLPAEVDRAAETGGELSLLLIDLDHFKSINDTHGHDVGDKVLERFAQVVKDEVRAIDVACRHGGEEFAVVMPGAGIDMARSAAERLRARVARETFAKGLKITVSIGVAGFEAGDTESRIVKRADRALYAAKQRGRNRVVTARLKKAA
jgi:two-component system cell cycle response regulator